MLLKEYSYETALDRFRYAKSYADCLLSGNLSGLRMLSDEKRLHVLKALSALSKFLGIHEEFKVLVRNHGLKWTGRNADHLIISRLNRNSDGNEIVKWIMEVKKADPELSLFLDFMFASGLRFNEAVESWNLIIELSRRGELEKYFNNGVLEHFRFKERFIRPKKKAFISIVPESMIQEICGTQPLTMNQIKKRLQRRNIKMRFGDLREFYASYMTRFLRECEINFLQGRISASTFMQNYFNPALIGDLKDRTLRGINKALCYGSHDPSILVDIGSPRFMNGSRDPA